MKVKPSLVIITGMSLASTAFLQAGVTMLNATGSFYADSTSSSIAKRVEIGTTKINESSLLTTYLEATVDCYFNGVRIGKGSGNVSTNTAIGFAVLNGANSTGHYVTGVGSYALQYNSSGNHNTAIGHAALQVNTTGNYNTASGVSVLRTNTTGSWNTGDGVNSLLKNQIGNYNTAIGQAALQENTAGLYNTALGVQALLYNQGSWNIGLGMNSLVFCTTGNSNIAIGNDAANMQRNGTDKLTTAYGSIYIGAGCRGMSNADNNSIVLGTGAWGEGANTTVIGNGATVSTHLYGKTISDSLQVNGNTVINGNTVLSGTVVLAQAQGDISMGAYQ